MFAQKTRNYGLLSQRGRAATQKRLTTEATEFAEKDQAIFSVLSVRSVADLFFAAREEV
jgi:hypothetical protein